jgi:tetratricopeptide (TPR) repeat protein
MRLGEWMQAAGSCVPVVWIALAAGPAAAQFREVQPDGSSSQAVEIQLTPTREQFVAPKLEPVPETHQQPTPAEVLPGGMPTLADPPKSVPPETTADKQPKQEPAAAEPAPPTAAVKAVEPFSAFRRPADPAGQEAPTPPAQAVPISFNQITPGETTLVHVEGQWGPPARTVSDDGDTICSYRAPGFAQVDLTVSGGSNQVRSILVHLSEPMDVQQVVEHLGLGSLRSVEITDDSGDVLGLGYPERGVLLNYADDGAGKMISHVSLEPISGELYRLRAETDQHQQHTASLADLEQAVRLNPQDGQAYWLQAELLSLVGRTADAWQSITTATRIEADNRLYQLTRARLAAGNGDLTEALLFTKNVAQDKTTPTVVKARAEYQWGNMLALGPTPDYQEALNHHLKAIELAARHAGDAQPAQRRMAKDILIDAHLAIAQDVALGNFQRQREVVPKWLSRATELAEDFISGDAGDETVRMEIYRTTLAVYSVLEGNFDASIATDEAIKEGQRLVAASKDRRYQFRVERELSEALYHAAKVEHRCGRLSTALKYANNSVVLMESDQQYLQPSLFDRIMSGQLYFLIGSIYALKDEDHAEAVKWFDKALPTFDDERLAGLVDNSAFGDLFVSMGVSFWESGERNKAIELSQKGADLMQQGVQAGSIEMAALSVPYGNLAAMHQQMGNGEKAKHFATMMAKIDDEAKQVRR